MDRAALLDLGTNGDAATFVNLAHPILSRHPQDSDLRILLVRRLAEAGLFHRAARIAEGFPEDLLRRQDFKQLIQQLHEPRNNGLADWQGFVVQYESNLNELRQRDEWADEMDSLWRRRRAELELHRTREGRWEVFDSTAGGGAWRPRFGVHAAALTAERLVAETKNRVLAPIVIDGIGLGSRLRVFFDGTRDTLHGASPLIYVVEPEPLALTIAMHLEELGDVIRHQRVVFCAGPSALDRFRDALSARPDVFPPQIVVSSPHWAHAFEGRVGGVMKETQQKLASRCSILRAQIQNVYKCRDAEYWHARFREALEGGVAPLRVLALTSRFTTVLQFATRDSLSALTDLGCSTRLLIEPDDHGHITPQRALAVIQEFEPDLIFMVDHSRRSQQQCLIENVPLMTWVQDRLPWLFEEAAGKAMGQLDFAMGLGFEELTGRCRYPPDRFMPCEMATRPNAFLPTDGGDDASEGDTAEFDCDVAFATHASETPDALHRAFVEQAAGEAARPFLDAVFEELCRRCEKCELSGALDFECFFRQMSESAGFAPNDELRRGLIAHHIRPLVERFLRQQTIRWAAAWADSRGKRLHLYGKGWERHPEFARFARGVIPHGPKLGRAFRQAIVNIHAGCNHALHQRVLDGLAAGGFFLVRRHAADIAHPISKALYAWVLRQGLRPPASIPMNGLPSDIRRGIESLRRMRGVDGHVPLRLTDAYFSRLAEWHENPHELTASKLWPEFEKITFATEAELAALLDRTVDHPEWRRECAASMRRAALANFGYQALMARMLKWMTTRLAVTGQHAAAGAKQAETLALCGAN